MGEFGININGKNSILVSRNTPVAFIVGVAGFIGSHLAQELLNKKIQVIGVDDFSTGKKEHLSEVSKNKNFHLVNRSISEPLSTQELYLRRIDYAYFIVGSEEGEIYTKGLLNFLNFIKETKENLIKESEQNEQNLKLDPHKPRIVLVSSINLYGSKLSHEDQKLKDGEIRFARFIKYHNLNGRIVRTSAIFGPRMHFREEEPIIRLIQSTLNNKINEFPSTADFSTRSLYIDDLTKLLLKSILSGATAQKIFDAVSPNPIKVAEIKQILLDPVWHEMKKFKPSELPPWPTPNLNRTIKELSWKPETNIIEGLKNTISYFKDNNINTPELAAEQLKIEGKKWSFANFVDEDKNDEKSKVSFGSDKKERQEDTKRRGKFKRFVFMLIILGVIGYGLVFPFVRLAVGALTIRQNLKTSAEAIQVGDFKKAEDQVNSAETTLSDSKRIVDSLILFKRVGVFKDQLNTTEQALSIIQDGILGVKLAVSGTKSLFETTKIISGEKTDDSKPLFERAQQDLTAAGQKIARVKISLDDPTFYNKLPGPAQARVKDLAEKLGGYTDIVEKTKAASFLMPQMVAVDGRKSYLVLLQNNLELRAGGGFIGSFARLTFEKGRITDIKVDDIYNLDGNLQEVIDPPTEVKHDLGQNRFYLRDANTEPDFPTSARTAEFFYKKEAGEQVNGVIAMDLTSSSKLLSAVGGIDLPDYGEHIDGGNLFEKAITHAEVNFFPGSQAKKNYLTSLQTQLFNKIFYLTKQNWPAVIDALSKSLEQKHLMVYLADPTLFSYLVSENWAGVLPRGVEDGEGQTSDFLMPVEANYGANKANFYLDRRYKLATSIGKEGQIYHKLSINYKNNSPSDVFPAGTYKNRFKIYLPLGTKLTKAAFGETDITSQVTSFVDYGRTAYTMLVQLAPKQQSQLILEYTLSKNLNFKNNNTKYRLNIIKQAGTGSDLFDWQFTYPINFKVGSYIPIASSSNQEVNISTNLLQDRSFEVNLASQ